jgi:hypothetical protein
LDGENLLPEDVNGMTLPEPHEGELVTELWKYVARLTRAYNALANAEVKGPNVTGKVITTEDHAAIVIETTNE